MARTEQNMESISLLAETFRGCAARRRLWCWSLHPERLPLAVHFQFSLFISIAPFTTQLSLGA